MEHFFSRILITFLLAGVLLPMGAHAASGPIVRSGDTVVVESNQILEGDFYGFGNSLVVSGTSQGDLYGGGMDVTLNGPVEDDVAVLGASIQLHGSIGDDARVIGGTVVIGGPVAGDVVVVGGSVHVLSTAVIEGDFMVIGGDVRIDGPIKGSVYGTMNDLRMNAPIDGTVSVRSMRHISLGDRAAVVGDIQYTSQQELVRSPGAVVTGTIHRNPAPLTPDKDLVREMLVNVFIAVFGALVLGILFRARLGGVVNDVTESYGKFGLIGFGVLCAVPLLSIVLISSIIGMLVGFLLFGAYLILLGGAWLIAGVVLGMMLNARLFKNRVPSIAAMVLGTVLFSSLLFVPFVGPFVVIPYFLMVFGSIVMRIYGVIRG